MALPADAQIPFAMLVVFGSAKLMAEVFERLGQPGIVGEIVAGVLIGPSVLGWIAPTPFLMSLAQLGVMFLLFQVGLEVKSSDLLKVGSTAAMAAATGIALSFALGWGILRLWGSPQMEAIFLGAAIAATSVAVTAQVLSAKGLLSAQASKIILAAAVIDDVLGLLVLGLVSSLARGRVNVAGLAFTGAMALGFTLIVAKWGTRAARRMVPHIEPRLRIQEAQFALSLCLLFALSVAAVYAGVAAIVGAFLAGMALSETVDRRVNDLAHGVAGFLVPFFLAGTGLNLNVTVFGNAPTVALAGVVLAAAVLAKVVGCGLGAARLGRRDALRVGVGMIPRGEVGLVAAQIGQNLGAITPQVYGVVILVTVATTLVAPPLLAAAFRGAPRAFAPGQPAPPGAS